MALQEIEHQALMGITNACEPAVAQALNGGYIVPHARQKVHEHKPALQRHRSSHKASHCHHDRPSSNTYQIKYPVCSQGFANTMCLQAPHHHAAMDHQSIEWGYEASRVLRQFTPLQFHSTGPEVHTSQ